MNGKRPRPLVWYLAAGYGLPAGIEAHVLHYATEMRNHGFDTRVVVFKRLPTEKHRFLRALEERDIPIISLADKSAARASTAMVCLFIPWFLYSLMRKRRVPSYSSFAAWIASRESLSALARLLAAERPDIIHIFGRLTTDAWARLPAERTIFHEMMTGTVDAHWTPEELADFRSFAEKAARYFAPGSGVAENVKREFGIKRRIDTIFTMCPEDR